MGCEIERHRALREAFSEGSNPDHQDTGSMKKREGQAMQHIAKLVRTSSMEVIELIPATKRAAEFLDKEIDQGLTQPLAAPDCLELSAVEVFGRAATNGIEVQDLQMVLGSMRKDAYTFGARHNGKALDHDEALQRLATFDSDIRDPVKAEGLLTFVSVLRFNAAALSPSTR